MPNPNDRLICILPTQSLAYSHFMENYPLQELLSGKTQTSQSVFSYVITVNNKQTMPVALVFDEHISSEKRYTLTFIIKQRTIENIFKACHFNNIVSDFDTRIIGHQKYLLLVKEEREWLKRKSTKHYKLKNAHGGLLDGNEFSLNLISLGNDKYATIKITNKSIESDFDAKIAISLLKTFLSCPSNDLQGINYVLYERINDTAIDNDILGINLEKFLGEFVATNEMPSFVTSSLQVNNTIQ